MKKLLFIFLFVPSIALAQVNQDVSQLLIQAKKSFLEEDMNGYPAAFLQHMLKQDRKNFEALIQKYNDEPTKEQKTWATLIERVSKMGEEFVTKKLSLSPEDMKKDLKKSFISRKPRFRILRYASAF